MNLTAFSKQLVHDMKASAAKTAVLGLLLLVGLFFWVPPLLKAFSSDPPSVPRSPVVTKSTATTAPAASPVPNKKLHDSKTLFKLLHQQPLLQPVSAAEMPQKPFGLNDELLPLPVLIAEDTLDELTSPALKPVAQPVVKLDGLVLKSTLIGPSRRVAIINNQLLREGQSIAWNDRQLRLESVNRKSVTLTDGSQSWQLTLKNTPEDSAE